MHASGLILTLTGSLAAALTIGFITQRLGLSPIVGYLLAGLIVGPYTPGFVADRVLANEFAEIGVILLMFGVGLHFRLKDLLAVRNVAVTGALCQSAAATLLGAIAGRTFSWSWSASLVFGLALSVASTVMLMRVLVDNQDLQTRTARIAIGWWCDQPNCRRVHRLTDIESSAVSVYRMAGCGACAIAWGVANAQSQDALLGSRQG